MYTPARQPPPPFPRHHGVPGPRDLPAPGPVPNPHFMRPIGRGLHRPTVLPAPGFGLRIVLGEFAEDVLTGQRAVPAALTGAGFEFEHSDVEDALPVGGGIPTLAPAFFRLVPGGRRPAECASGGATEIAEPTVNVHDLPST